MKYLVIASFEPGPWAGFIAAAIIAVVAIAWQFLGYSGAKKRWEKLAEHYGLWLSENDTSRGLHLELRGRVDDLPVRLFQETRGRRIRERKWYRFVVVDLSDFFPDGLHMSGGSKSIFGTGPVAFVDPKVRPEALSAPPEDPLPDDIVLWAMDCEVPPGLIAWLKSPGPPDKLLEALRENKALSLQGDKLVILSKRNASDFESLKGELDLLLELADEIRQQPPATGDASKAA